jgi:hypothetical protein
MSLDHPFECNAPDVVFENFGDEVILLNLRSGNYYSLDPLGMFYWEYLSQGVPPREIAAHICEFYAGQTEEAEIAGDLDALCAEFQSEELIRPSKTSRAVADISNATAILPAEYVCPAISKFDDVADMLLLDPVHDVSEVGWPHPAPANPKEDRAGE